MLAIAGSKPSLIAVLEQRIDVVISYRPDITAATAIATVGAALWNEFFTPKGSAAVTTSSGLYFDARFINELHD
jgi:hypothetical protein